MVKCKWIYPGLGSTAFANDNAVKWCFKEFSNKMINYMNLQTFPRYSRKFRSERMKDVHEAIKPSPEYKIEWKY